MHIWHGAIDDLIKIGQTLALSMRSAGSQEKAETGQQVASQKLLYKVMPGDSLWRIGRQFGIKTQRIRDWNDLSSSHMLQPGQMLMLMVPVAQQG